MSTIESEFLKYSADKLEQQTSRIEACLARLTPDQVWMRGGENQNAIGNLMLHLSGNVRQWILHGVGGEEDHRVRDLEFSRRQQIPIEDLKADLRLSVDGVVKLLGSDLNAGQFLEKITIQNYTVTKMTAIYHVVEHYSYHTGQIIFLTKWLTGEDPDFYSHLENKDHGERVP